MVCERRGLSSESRGKGIPGILSPILTPNLIILGDSRQLWVLNGEAAKEAKERALARENRLPKGMSEIIFGFLFLGSGRDARDHEGIDLPLLIECQTTLHLSFSCSLILCSLDLLANEVSHVLNVTQEWTPSPHHAITHHSIPLFDVLDEVQQLCSFSWLGLR